MPIAGRAESRPEAAAVSPTPGYGARPASSPFRLGLLASVLLIPPAGVHGCGFDCNAMDARGRGECRLALGYARNNFPSCSCSPVVGCECDGADCDQLFASFAECVETVEVVRL